MRAALRARRGHLRPRRARRRASPTAIVVARNGSPVVLGIGEQGDVRRLRRAALVRHTQQVVHLDDGEMADVRADGFERVHARRPRHAPRRRRRSTGSAEDFDKGGHDHYMRKEIAEQPEAVRAHAARPARAALRDRAPRRPARSPRASCSTSAACADPRLRLGLLRGPRRRAADRAAGAHPGRRRAGLGVPLPQPGDRARHALHRRQPVGRDLRHARRRAGGQAQGRPRARHRQRRRLEHRARMRGRASTCTPGPEIVGRLDQDVHLHAPSPSRCSRCTSAGCATSARPTARGIIAGLEALPGQIRGDPRAARTRSPRSPPSSAQAAQRVLHRPRARLPDRARGRAEAQGDHLRPRRGLPGLRAQARAAGAGRRRSRRRWRSCPTTRCSRRTSRRSSRCGRAAGRCSRSPTGRWTGWPTTRSWCPRSEPELDPILLGIPLQLLAYHAAVALGRDIDQPRNLAKSVTVE